MRHYRGMPIIADTKNWTWVGQRRCAECGFDPATVTERDVAERLRCNAAAWPAVLNRADVAARPDESTWSPLEYAAHVRDVYRTFGTRLALMLEQDDPVFADWDQDDAAVTGRYNEQDPTAVAGELSAAGAALAEAFDAVPETAWTRPGRRSDGECFTVASFAVYLAHDSTHHLWDVRER